MGAEDKSIDLLEPLIWYRLLRCNPPQFIRGFDMSVSLYRVSGWVGNIYTGPESQ